MQLVAVNYHYVRPRYDHPHEGIYGITPAQLKAQLEQLARLGTFVGVDDVVRAVRGERALPARSIAITFDDAFREQVDHALPVLDDLGVPAIFYVNTDPIERGVVSPHHKVHLLRAHTPPAEFFARVEERARALGINLDVDTATSGESGTQYRYDDQKISRLKYLLNLGLPHETRAALIDPLFAARFPGAEAELSRALYMDRPQLQLLAARGMLGNHAHEHLPLGLLPVDRARALLARTQELLQQWTGHTPQTFSYPFGSRSATSAAVGDIARSLGFVFGFTMERALNVDLSDPLHLARMDTNDVPGGKSWRGNDDALFSSTPTRSWYGAAARA